MFDENVPSSQNGNEVINSNEQESTSDETLAKIKKTLHSDSLKSHLIEKIGNYFDVDRCLFVDYDSTTEKFLPFQFEKLKSLDLNSIIDVDTESSFPEFCSKLKNKKKDIIIKDLDKIFTRKKFFNCKSLIKLNEMEVKSDYWFLVCNEEEIIGALLLQFLNQKRILARKDFALLNLLREQAGITFYQIKLYENEKKTAQREKLLREIGNIIRNTLDIKQIKKNFFTEVCKYFNADRCYIELKDLETGKYKETLPGEEYLSSPAIKTYAGRSIESPEFKHFKDKFDNKEDIILYNKIDYMHKFGLEHLLEFANEYSIKSVYGLPIIYADKVLGGFYVQYHQHEVILDNDDIEFLRVLANQLAIALHQANLLENEKKNTEKESLIRSITETIRSSINIDETKKQIVNVVGKTFHADRCFIIEFNKKADKFLIISEEYLSSDNISSCKGVNINESIPNIINAFKKGKRLVVNQFKSTLNDDIIDFNSAIFEEERNVIQKYNIRSALVFPLFYSYEFLGDLVLHYVEKEYFVSDKDINFLNLLSSQIAIAIYQSKLYEKIQLQAERERVSRNIIEILRSTLDKAIIKHLFVKNIGKYFNADRVFFSEYNTNLKMYEPIDKNSEYLSSMSEKSFIEYNWSNPGIQEHISPLLEKREIKIPNWQEYINAKQNTSNEFLDLYKDANVQSSYNFPVLYENTIIGYFCIDFTSKIVELSDDDIVRIRSICSQAGIALYHAELYKKAQNALQSKDRLIHKVSNEIKDPVDSILNDTKILSEQQLVHEKQLVYLNNIINSCDKLLELTRTIADESNF